MVIGPVQPVLAERTMPQTRAVMPSVEARATVTSNQQLTRVVSAGSGGTARIMVRPGEQVEEKRCPRTMSLARALRAPSNNAPKARGV
jgi:hypothetical protein